MQNIFTRLGGWFTAGNEDFFTACLAIFLERNESLREQFLRWLSPHDERKWIIEAQVTRPSNDGDAILDMELSSDGLILWFEHKVRARADANQIEKYLDAANRVMLGVKDARPVEWPIQRQREFPRVLLFLITRSLESLDRQRYSGKIYTKERPFGFVWSNPVGHLRWRDFWGSAQEAFTRPLAGEMGEVERALSKEFLAYWKSQRGMWKQGMSATSWADLLPPRYEKDLPEDQPCGFYELWSRNHGIRELGN